MQDSDSQKESPAGPGQSDGADVDSRSNKKLCVQMGAFFVS